MKKILISIVMMLSLGFIVGCSSDNEDAENAVESKDQTISLGVTPWTSTVPPTQIARQVIEGMGYDVEEVNADVSSIYVGLSRGDIDAYMDSWFPVHNTYLDKYEEDVEQTAKSFGPTESGFVVPEYMEDINEISDLEGKEDMFDNTFYGLEKGGSASVLMDEMIEAYDLDLEQLNSSEGGMLAEVKRTMQKEEPIVFYGWRPHTMFNQFDIKILDDVKEIKEESSVFVMSNKELKENAPDVYNFLSNWSMDMDDLEDMMKEIENDDKDPEDVASDWIDANQDKIDEMLED